MYEVVWLQLLQLVLGLTTISLGLLLGTFMGGMCLGSLLLPRWIGTAHHPLRVYALIELLLAVCGIGVLFLVPLTAHWYERFAAPGVSGLIFRGVVAAVCLLPPTILMGATLPAISRYVKATPAGVSWMGFFYGGNIAGAVIGCLVAGFYLLRVYDMATATYVAASMNVGVAGAAWWLSRHARHQPETETPAPGEAAPPSSRLVYAVIALSGFTALGAEVVWTRLLSLTLGGTVYTFSLILAVFLVGLGLGSTGGAFLARSVRNPKAALGWCQWCVAASVAWTALMISKSLPYWPVNPELSTSPWFTFQIDLVRCLWATLPGTIFWGASFPLALAAVASARQDAGRLIGGVYAANTLGAILGALGFALWFIPQFGTQRAQQALILFALVAAALAMIPAVRQVPGGVVLRFALVPLVVAGLVLAATVAPAPWGLVAHGRFMATYGPQLAPGVVNDEDVPTWQAKGEPDVYCTYLGEGLNGSVAVTKWRNGYRYFHSAGKVQASSDPADMRLQRLLGHISALAVPEPRKVLVVACGAGVTAGTFTLYPELEQLTICDIEPLVPQRVAPQFKEQNYDVVNHPRTRVVSDDGRHFVRTSREKFDVITSDPIDPWVKGCAALNTLEYYTWCKERLNPGGVMTLWIPLYESNPETAKSVIATFFKVFPHGVLWSNDKEGQGYDAVLFGQTEPTVFDLERLQARFDRPDYERIRQSLAEAGFPRLVDLLGTYAGQASDLREWMADAQLNSDRNLRLQYLAGLSFNSFVGTEILGQILGSFRYPDNLFIGSDASRAALIEALKAQGRPVRAAD